SGVVATPIILSIHAAYPALPLPVITMGVLGAIAFLTIGGKAAEKGFAVRASTSVLLLAGKGIHYLNRILPLARSSGGKRPRRERRTKKELASGHAPGKHCGLRSSRFSQRPSAASPQRRFPLSGRSAASPQTGLDYH